MRELLMLIAYMFKTNHEIAVSKRKARNVGIDPKTNAEFRLANDLEVM